MRVPGHLALYSGWEDSGENGRVTATGILRARSISGAGRVGGREIADVTFTVRTPGWDDTQKFRRAGS